MSRDGGRHPAETTRQPPGAGPDQGGRTQAAWRVGREGCQQGEGSVYGSRGSCSNTDSKSVRLGCGLGVCISNKRTPRLLRRWAHDHTVSDKEAEPRVRKWGCGVTEEATGRCMCVCAGVWYAHVCSCFDSRNQFVTWQDQMSEQQ